MFHPFEAGHLELPGGGSHVLFLGAAPDFRLPDGFAARLTIVQGFRPVFLELERRGLEVLPRIDGSGYDMALVLAGRHRGQNEIWMREAAARIRDGGLVVVAASKKNGGDSLRRRTAKFVELGGHLSKHHGMVFWFDKPASPLPEPDDAQAQIDGRFQTAPGMFSHGRVDAGSELLSAHLPASVRGAVADLGAGWGYLSARLLERAEPGTVLHLYEADHASCGAARANLAAAAEGRAELDIFWQDVTSERLVRLYDTVVMNPPFHHAGHGADPSLGIAMIEAAAKGLKKGGRLYMVANAALPYEAALGRLFAGVEEVAREQGYKVIVARR
ncbi:MAG: class I SAM-dependent methyltransferase [Rhizobiaceae bacterium]